MGLETGSVISDLVITNPTAGDPTSQGDDHLRLLKTVLKGTPLIIDRATAEYTSNADLTVAIPLDDTIPQVTEGTQILSVSITPKSTTNKVRVRFQGQVIANGALNLIGALFLNGGANAVRTAYTTNAGSGGFATELVLEYEHTPGATSAQTYTLRVGSHTGAAIRLNGSHTGRYFGGTSAATLIAEEIQG
jgi:hypothetical protein